MATVEISKRDTQHVWSSCPRQGQFPPLFCIPLRFALGMGLLYCLILQHNAFHPELQKCPPLLVVKSTAGQCCGTDVMLLYLSLQPPLIQTRSPILMDMHPLHTSTTTTQVNKVSLPFCLYDTAFCLFFIRCIAISFSLQHPCLSFSCGRLHED